MLNGWNRFLNAIHTDGQLTSNQVQNLGSKVLSETEFFDGRHIFPPTINREFRMLLGQAMPYRDRFEGFLASVSNATTDVIRILADCDRVLEEDLLSEIRNELARAGNCAIE